MGLFGKMFLIELFEKKKFYVRRHYYRLGGNTISEVKKRHRTFSVSAIMGEVSDFVLSSHFVNYYIK